MSLHKLESKPGWTAYKIGVIVVLVGIAALGVYRVFLMK